MNINASRPKKCVEPLKKNKGHRSQERHQQEHNGVTRSGKCKLKTELRLLIQEEQA